MRIVGGRYRGRKLAALGKGDPAAALRPTTDRVRESLFNILQGGRFDDPLTDARVLDLFAGTGALGFEALSRGASFVTFVENGRKALAIIAENARFLGCKDAIQVVPRDAGKLPPSETPATLVFLDPPYGQGLGEGALQAAVAQGWIAQGALIVWEEAARMPPPDGFEECDARRFGDSWITFLQANA